MARELPRTLATLAPGYQAVPPDLTYEVVLVDNGSPSPIADEVVADFPGPIRSHRLSPAPPSPARAANEGLRLATGDLVGLVIDGARMASPGLLAQAWRARRLADRPIITAPAWHLGSRRHGDVDDGGGDQRAEDELLASVPWETDGYELFGISTFANSSGRGWFGALGESSSLFLPAALWAELGGLDESFALPGGGMVNHDLFRRACALPDVELVVLLGEGTFHQHHGGVATSGRLPKDEMTAEYEALRGSPYERPTNDALYFGTVPQQALPHLHTSIEMALERRARADRKRAGR